MTLFPQLSDANYEKIDILDSNMLQYSSFNRGLLWVRNKNQFFTKVSNILCNKVIIGPLISSIEEFGKIIMGKSLPIITFIIKMVISKTIELKTWGAYISLSIEEYIMRKKKFSIKNVKLIRKFLYEKKEHGTYLKKERILSRKTHGFFGTTERTELKYV
jgi:hypothetical protein